MDKAIDGERLRKAQDLCRWISFGLLLFHCYFFCYQAFDVCWHLTHPLMDRVLVAVMRTGIFLRPGVSKLMVAAFLALSLTGAHARKDQHLRPRRGIILILSGLLVYMGSDWILQLDAGMKAVTFVYIGTTMLGYLLIVGGGKSLARVISASLRKEFFPEGNGGFRQQEERVETDFSINLAGVYSYEGRQRKSQINFINARRGLLIMGSPGSGKSWFIIEPAIRQLMSKGFAMFIYDFKYDHLTRLAYACFQEYRDSYPPGTAFYQIAPTDLSRSHRCNVLSPDTLEWLSDAIGASRTILLSMNKTWVHKQGEFFVESPVNFLAALIWWLRQVAGGKYCTLPHVIELAQQPYDKLFTVLGAEPSISTLIQPFIEAYLNNSMELVDSQIASARIPLGRLASPDLYYVLTGEDCSLAINDPLKPKIISLGSCPPRQEGLAPILSLYIDRLNKLINRPGQYKCALICDEFATIRAASIFTTIATGRSNNIIPVLAIQDLSQLKTMYSREEADLVLNICGNLACGQAGGETARWVSERFPGTTQYRTTVSVNSSDTSYSKSTHTANELTPAVIANLSSGEFVGITADDPGKEITLKAFHARLIKEPVFPGPTGLDSLPILRDLSPADVEENYTRIKKDIEVLVKAEVERIGQDPDLVHLVVKKRGSK